jgi:hypothetical protein
MDDKLIKQHVIKQPPNAETMRFLGMISTYPKNATFATQNDTEVVVMVVRRHLFKNFGWLFTAAIAALVPYIGGMVIYYFDHNFNQDMLLNSSIVQAVNGSYIFVLGLFYYSFVVTYAYFKYIHWFYDIFIITNERYISIDFDILKGKTIIDIPLTDIVDISEKILGFLPTLIGYGNIEFKTLSEKFIVLEDIPEPTWFRDSLADLIKFIRAQFESAAEGGGKEMLHAGHATHLGHAHDSIKVDVDADVTDAPGAKAIARVTGPNQNIKDIEP